MKPEEIEKGKPVIYWAIIKNDGTLLDPKKTEITSGVSKLGDGTDACKVKGVSGVVDIEHLDKITPGSLMAAKVQGLTEITTEDFQEASEKFIAERGGNVDVEWHS